MTQIHPSAIVDPAAELADDVKVGPFCLVGPSAKIAAGVELVSHVVVEGNTSIGERTKVYPFASLGHPPQDLKYHGEDNQLIIGSDNVIREQVTMNPGTEGGGGITQIGNNGTFLTASHVGHDCRVGNHVVFSNNVMLAGHCDVSDFAILSGGCGVHQFVRIGPHAFIGGLAGVEHDVIPYGMVIGNRAYLAGLNVIGLKRRGFGRDQIHQMRAAYRMLFAEEGTMAERVADAAGVFGDNVDAMEIVNFIRTAADRSICTPQR